MASVASIDRSLGRLSSWLSAAAFCGLMALAFLPGREPGPSVHETLSSPVPKLPAGEAAVAESSTVASSASKTIVPAAKPEAAAKTQTATEAAAATKAQTTPAVAPTAAAPAVEAAAPAPPPDVWTPEEMAAGLRHCVQLLAPAAFDLVMAEPMKRGACGTPAPLALRSIGSAQKVEFSPAPTMNCHLAATLGEWVEKVLQPAAQQELGSRIQRIVGASSYSCRNIYNNPLLKLSEHATGNAIDIAGFVTADGRTVMVLKGWGPTERDIAAAKKKADEAKSKASGKEKSKETPKEAPRGTDGEASKDKESAAVGSIQKAAKAADAKRGAIVQKADFKKAGTAEKAAAPGLVVASTSKEARFLKRVHEGSCEVFSTVLGPEANEAHRDHFHLDVKTRRSRGVCQ